MIFHCLKELCLSQAFFNSNNLIFKEVTIWISVFIFVNFSLFKMTFHNNDSKQIRIRISFHWKRKIINSYFCVLLHWVMYQYDRTVECRTHKIIEANICTTWWHSIAICFNDPTYVDFLITKYILFYLFFNGLCTCDVY